MKTKKQTGKKRQLYDDRTGDKKAYSNKSEYAKDYDTKEEVKESEDNWNNEGGAIASPDKGFEKPLLSYDNSKDQKKIKKPYSTKVRVSKVTKSKDEGKEKRRRA